MMDRGAPTASGTRASDATPRCLPISSGKSHIATVASAETSELDRILAGRLPAYTVDRATSRIRWIAEAAAFHIAHNPVYARLAQARDFNASTVTQPEDLFRVPLVPTSLFKKKQMASHLVGKVQNCASSGTGGQVSSVPRDQPTLERFMHGLLLGTREFYPYRENRRAYILAPRPEEADTLWFSFVTSLLDIAFDADFFVEREQLQVDRLIDRLADRPRGEQPIIVSPPSLLFDLCFAMAARSIAIDLAVCDPQIITGGGWKRRANEQVDRGVLAAMVKASLGVPAGSVRDMFNMVELNTLIYECEFQRKHAPPWLHVSARSAYDNSPCPAGDIGLLAYLDPTPTSYPGFVLSDDYGYVDPLPCPCGRTTSTFVLDRRLTGIEERGCSLKMDRYSDNGLNA